jgi:hypothetical protein
MKATVKFKERKPFPKIMKLKHDVGSLWWEGDIVLFSEPGKGIYLMGLMGPGVFKIGHLVENFFAMESWDYFPDEIVLTNY